MEILQQNKVIFQGEYFFRKVYSSQDQEKLLFFIPVLVEEMLQN